MEEQTVIQSLLSITFFTYYKTLPLSQLSQWKLKVKASLCTQDWMVDRQAANLHASTIKKEPDRQRITLFWRAFTVYTIIFFCQYGKNTEKGTT